MPNTLKLQDSCIFFDDLNYSFLLFGVLFFVEIHVVSQWWKQIYQGERQIVVINL